MAKLIRQDDIKASGRQWYTPLTSLMPAKWGGMILLAAMVGGLGGLPRMTPNQSITFTTAAQAQTLSSKVPAYIDAIFEVERIRIEYWQKIKGLMNGEPLPDQGCHSQNLKSTIKQTCADFLKACSEIVEAHGLTPQDFNNLQDERTKKTQLGVKIEKQILMRQQRGGN